MRDQRPRPRRAIRLTSVLIWTALIVVGAMRILTPVERVEWGRGPFPTIQFQGQQRMMRRAPSRTPGRVMVEVPKDLWRIEIEIAERDANKLRRYFWNGRGNGGGERPEVLATVREGGVVYTNVAIHLKGSAGSFQAFDDKPALTLNFTKHAKGQKFHGYSKFSLNNSRQDGSYLSEMICRELFEAAGVPVPKAEHATVVLNGMDKGLYVLAEGWGKPMLRRYFDDVSGNLYDGGFVQDVDGDVSVNSGDDEEDHRALRRLVMAAREPDARTRWERLTEVLDVDRFATFVALEVMTCHWDGYSMNRNNYRVFHDRARDKMVFMPHGMDQMFGVFRSSPTSSIRPRMQGLVARAYMGTPEGPRKVRAEIERLRAEVFLPEKMTRRANEVAERLRPTLAAYGPEYVAEHEAEVRALCQRMMERAESISAQLAKPTGLLVFDANGEAKLGSWRPRITAQGDGAWQFEQGGEDGHSILSIQAPSGSGSGSWRTTVILDAGRYVFVGRVRTEGMAETGGVCLRISGARGGFERRAHSEWSELRFEFEVMEPESEVELVCEVARTTGRVWFDQDSLRLVRE